MHDPTDQPTIPVLVEEVPVPRGYPILAWLVILLVAAGIIVWPWIRPPRPDEELGDEHLELLVFRMYGRCIVGAIDSFPDTRDPLVNQVQTFNSGTVGQRMRFAILAGELRGPDAALTQLHELDLKLAQAARTKTPEEQRVLNILNRLYSAYDRGRFDAPTVSDADRDFLIEQLAWFGQLALAPAAGPNVPLRAEVMAAAHRTFMSVMTFARLIALIGLIGLVGLIVFTIYLAGGKVRSRLEPELGNHGIYAETFALWLALFVGLEVALTYAPKGDARWSYSLAGEFLSLAALAWPVLRGLSWRQVRRDIGWTFGPRPLLEPFLGGLTYAMAWPLLAIGVLLFLLLSGIQQQFQGGAGAGDEFDTNQVVSHPIVIPATAPDWWLRLQIILLACVAAPLIEETIFRGVLYRHLRGASGRLGTAWSALLSAALTSFLFAALHPQGLLFVPVLMALALAFTLAREWRGTLIPGIVAHALTNGVTLTLIIVVLGS
jgi:membrane protease YdiL (CAAX protease family)